MRVPHLFSFLLAAGILVGCDSGPTDPGGELEIIDLVVGTGDAAELGQTLVSTFEGRLEDGSIFYSTDPLDEEYIFTLNVSQVLLGWVQGLPGMLEGGTRRLVIPPSLAFGKDGWCPGDNCLVPSYEVVTFEVTLVSILDNVVIEDVVEGTGPAAATGDEVHVEYVGRFLSGQIFDTTENTGVPFTFTIGAGTVIQGWDIGLVGMRVGGTRNLRIPPHLAYGASTASTIPAYSVLDFQIILVGITGK